MAHASQIPGTSQPIEELLAAYWKGELSSTEEAHILRWRQESPDNEHLYQGYAKAWQQSRAMDPSPEFNVQAAWDKVLLQTVAQESKVVLSWWQQPIIRAAAAVVVVALLSWIFQYTVFKRPVYIDVIAGMDSILRHELPDKSVVTLRNGAKIRYSDAYNNEEREIWLDGEAFFEVQKNPKKTFTVVARRSRTIVKGTTFGVRSIESDTADYIAVEEGKVAVMEKYAQSAKEVFLTAGMSALTGSSGSIQVQSATAAPLYQPLWKTKHIRFQDQYLAEVVNQLQELYQVNIELHTTAPHTTPLGNCKYTGEFQDDSLEEVLEILGATLSLRIERHSDTHYILIGNACP